MSFHRVSDGTEAACQYAGSNLWFRAPHGNLETPYVACLGGEETFGRFVEYPYPALLAKRLPQPCINFGSLFCGADALLADPGVLNHVNGSDLCVLQVLDVPYQSNRFYRVHSRRNDRFLEPSCDLQDLYPEVDFTEIHFVRHLLERLRAIKDARFEVVAQELRETWLRNTSELVRRIKPRVVLLWLHIQRQEDRHRDLVLPDADMIEQVRPLCADVVECTVSVSSLSDEIEDVLFGTLQQPVAEHMLGPSAHREIALKLEAALRELN
ncbi:DUF6473 family protein [Ruegeria sp. HKCCSP351]|uniref:DUF6473 family protein n=1 Tax=Ruegeria sp. HKCCSP351 TaxID=2794832 RepID=UPI001FD7D821|nr:DUF6473 family protein [Ruegeria sp. HKCCSP351]